jgi:hypothetical protein
VPIREGLARLEGVESISRQPRVTDATCEVRTRSPRLLQPRALRQRLADLRVGARLRGVEATVDGHLEKHGDELRLRLAGANESLRLAPLQEKVQWDTRRRRPQEPAPDERSAFQRLAAGLSREASAVRIVGPFVEDEQGTLGLQVRQFHQFGRARPAARAAVLGIDVTGPYGLGEPWLTLRTALQRLSGVESVPELPDLPTATARIGLRRENFPDLRELAEAIRRTGAGASLRGVEVVLDGQLVEHGQQLALAATGGAALVPLAPLRRKIQRDTVKQSEADLTPAEAAAFDTLRAEWKRKPRPVRVVGRCVQMPDTPEWLVEVRRYAWHPVSETDDLLAEPAPPTLASREERPDRVPPSPPANLVATLRDGVIRLDWDENTEPDLYDYVMFRSTSPGGDYVQLTAGVPTNGYTIHSPERGVTYYFVVTAQDTAGNRSARSRVASVTVPREPAE